MKISLNWLRDHLPLPESPQAIADRLTAVGLEVEDVSAYESVPGSLAGLVVGKVLSCVPHPGADRLKVCQVDVGGAEPSQIVCGAPNVAEGQLVPVATPGAKLYPTEGEPFEIKRSKIRGEVSLGMICAEDEIGLGKSHEGILVLETDAAPGAPLDEVMDVYTDTIFEIGLTPNRTDAMSHYGVARDLAAATARKVSLPALAEHAAAAAPCPVEISLEAPERCPRYSGMAIRGVKVGESPDWLKRRLLAVGQRPINNIVDATNYVMLEIGQPLHAFDLSTIGGGKIVVRESGKQQKFVTLDEQERQLEAEDLLICDAERPLVVAGVMGGLNSGVTDATTDIFLESAYFAPTGIRRTSSRLGLFSETAYRFSRGCDPNITVYALERAADLVTELAGGTRTEINDEAAERFPHFEVKFSYAKANELFGMTIPREEINEILERLDIVVLSKNPDADDVKLHVPRYRTDVRRMQDVAEEVLRIYGYDRVPAAPAFRFAPANENKDAAYEWQEEILNRLSAAGCREIRTNSLLASSYATETSVNMLNPLSEENAVLRETMLPSGLDVVAWNLNRQQENLKLYELGKVFRKTEDGGYEERKKLAFYLTGAASAERWRDKSKPVDLFDLKAILGRLQVWTGQTFAEGPLPEDEKELAYGETLSLGKKPLGKFGAVRPQTLKQFGIRQLVFYAELDWELLLAAQNFAPPKYAPLPRFPEVRRDLSMLIDASVSYREIEQIIRKSNPKLVKSVSLFDVYQPEGESRRSYALAVILQDEQKTLAEKPIAKAMDKIIAALEKDGRVEVRKN